MAEFCLDCWNKLNHTQLAQEDVILSEDPDLCEGCVQVKPTIVRFSTSREQSRARRKRKRQNHDADGIGISS